MSVTSTEITQLEEQRNKFLFCFVLFFNKHSLGYMWSDVKSLACENRVPEKENEMVQ